MHSFNFIAKSIDMLYKLIQHGSREYDEMIVLRDEILRRPLGLTFSKEDLEAEKEDLLIGAYNDGVIAGCCVLSPEKDGTIRLRQMAVAGRFQGKGIGTGIMKYAEKVARERGYRFLSMHARVVAKGFYERLGYAVIGDEFTEVTIPHYLMRKAL